MSAPVLVWSARSTNGRWWLAIVGPEGTTLPCQGSVRHLGTAAGISTWLIEPGETGAWVSVAGEVTVHGGATVVASMSLQSGNYASILLLGPQAVVEHHGYNRRSSRIAAYINGEQQDIPAPVLLAMGLLQTEDGETVEVEPPPVLGGAMAAAFAALKGRN